MNIVFLDNMYIIIITHTTMYSVTYTIRYVCSLARRMNRLNTNMPLGGGFQEYHVE